MCSRLLLDRRSLQQCLSLASSSPHEVPVGALLRCNATQRILATSSNASISRHSSLAHAEMLALASAQQSLSASRLDNTTLYISLEPCLMCLGAALSSRVSRILYASRSPKYGSFSSPGGLALQQGAHSPGGSSASSCSCSASCPPPAWLLASPVRLQVQCAEDSPALRDCAEASAALLGSFFASRRADKGGQRKPAVQ